MRGQKAFEYGQQIALRRVEYLLHPQTWNTFKSIPDFSKSNWVTIKYLNDACDGFSNDISEIPNDSGGIYLFHINCQILPGMTEFPAYIGRAQLTQYQNLRKRCKEYFYDWKNDKLDRENLIPLFNYWGHNLYLSYVPMKSNKRIIHYEAKLVSSLMLPFNADRIDPKIKNATKAFRL